MTDKTIIIILVTLLLISCGGSDNQHYQGYVEGENLFLASPYSGVMVKKLANRGQLVKKGDLLFELDENPEALIIQQTDAELLQAKRTYKDLINPRRMPEINTIKEQIEQTNIQIRLAELRVRRTKELYKKNALDQDSADAAQSRYEELQHIKAQYQANLELAIQGSREEQLNAQQAQIQGLIAKLNQAKWQLEQKRIYAPADGVIFDTYFLKDEFVPSQHAIAALLAPDNIRIEFFVPAKALNSLHIGQKLLFSCDGCAKENHAQISYISPDAEYIPPLVYSDSNIDHLVFRIKAKIEHPDQYKPGQPIVVTELDHVH